MLSYWVSLVFAICLFSKASSQGDRKVVIIGSGSPQSIAVAENAARAGSGGIPIALDLQSLTYTNVSVFCEVVYVQEVDGFSQAKFIPLVLEFPSVNGTVLFIDNSSIAGRPAALQCWGVSEEGLFFRNTSISSAVPFVVTAEPKIYFKTTRLSVPRVDESPSSGCFQDRPSFTISFSESVSGAEVSITCDTANPSNFITIPSVTVPLNETEVCLSYSIQTGSAAISAEVLCTADSVSSDVDRQYSQVVTGQSAIFTLDQQQIVSYPTELTIHSLSFVVVLSVTESPSRSFTYKCCADSTHATVQDAEMALMNPSCFPVQVPDSTPEATTSPSVPIGPDSTTPTAGSGSSTDSASCSPVDNWVVQGGSLITFSSTGPNTGSRRVLVRRSTTPPFSTDPLRELVTLTCCPYLIESNKYAGTSASTKVSVEYSHPANVTVETGSTVIKNPAYVELSPCACDLTKESCDPECCCDPSCSDADKQAFRECTPGIVGGDFTEFKESHCPGAGQSSGVRKTSDATPFLCVFYENNAYLGLYFANKEKIAGSSNYLSTLSGAAAYTSYSMNDLSILPSSLPIPCEYQYEVEICSPISLPVNMPGGHCLQAGKLKYLVPSESVCQSALTPDLCSSKASILNARSFVWSSRLNSDLSAYPGDEFSVTLPYPVTTNYWCLSSSDATKYTNSPSGLEGSMLSFGQVTRCSFDNGYTRPPVSEYNTADQTCQNSVLAVRYTFTWNGKEIRGLDADFLLGDLPTVGLRGDLLKVSQEFTSKWVHERANPATLRELSGNPGYLTGKPVITRSSDASTVPERAAFTIPGVSGLCPNISVEPESFGKESVLFGEDVSAHCYILLQPSDYENCTGLRQLMRDQLSELHFSQMNFTSTGGAPNYSDPSDWASVIRVEPILNLDPPPTDDLFVSNSTNATVATPIASSQITIGGYCLQVPTGITATFLYSKTGAVNGEEIVKIRGVRISYTTDDWLFQCDSPTCRTARHSLSIKASFHRIPAVAPKSRIRYDVRKSDDCIECTPQWEELFYPMIRGFPEGTSHTSLVSSLIVIGITVAYLAVTSPWRH